jgi:hypothetical protein
MSLEDIIYNGCYNGPESKRMTDPSIFIICDRCKRTNIKSSVSYRGIDVCETCVEQFFLSQEHNAVKNKERMPSRMMARRFKKN